MLRDVGSCAACLPAVCFNFRALVLRHGQTDANAMEIEQGSADFSRLTELGKRQASNAYQALLDTALAEDDNNIVDKRTASIDSVYTSPLTRARQTLQQLRQADETSILPATDQILFDLREVDLYDWQGESYSDLRRNFPESWMAWEKGIPGKMKVSDSSNQIERYPILEMWERADCVWDEILDLEKKQIMGQNYDLNMRRTSLIVAHGNLGQALLGNALGFDASRFNDETLKFGNCGMAEIEFVDLDTSPRKAANRWRWRWPEPSSWMQ